MNGWRHGLINIWCVECGNGLDWAQPEFVARHPMPRCLGCQWERKAVYLSGPVTPVRDTKGLPPALDRRRNQWMRWWSGAAWRSRSVDQQK